MENYSQKLVKRICREKEKQEWANSHAPITSKIKYFILLTFAGNKRLKLVVAAVALSPSWFGCCSKQYVAKTILAASKRQNRQKTARFSLSMAGQGSLAQAGLRSHLQKWPLAPPVKRKPPLCVQMMGSLLWDTEANDQRAQWGPQVPPCASAQPLLTSLVLHRALVCQSRAVSHAQPAARALAPHPWLPAATELLTGYIPTKPLLSLPEWGEKLGSTICKEWLCLQCSISEVFISIKYKPQMCYLYLSSNQQASIVC